MPTRSREWTVMTWNVHGAARPDVDDLADVVALQDPDVVALQEIRHAQAATLATRLGMRFTWARKHWPYTPLLWWLAEGMAIMTPHRLDQAGHTVVSSSASAWSYRRRIAQWALVGRSDASAYRVINVHLSPGDLAAQRRAEAVRVGEVVDKLGDAPPAILAGDLNDHDDGTVIYALPGIEHVVPPPTNPADVPSQFLDHVLLPPDARDVALTVPGGGPQWAARSDHLPLTVRFTLDWVEGDFVSV